MGAPRSLPRLDSEGHAKADISPAAAASFSPEQNRSPAPRETVVVSIRSSA